MTKLIIAFLIVLIAISLVRWVTKGNHYWALPMSFGIFELATKIGHVFPWMYKAYYALSILGALLFLGTFAFKKRFKATGFIIILAMVFSLFVLAMAFFYPHTTIAVGASVKDGTGIYVLPIVGTTGETLTSADTTTDSRTPATFKDVRGTFGKLMTWKDLVDGVNKVGAQWYKDAVNDRSKSTGFNWADVEKWAKDPQLDQKTQLTIQAYGGTWNDDQVRAIAADIVGKELANKLPISRKPAGVLANTRSLGAGKVGNFLDIRNMVRVTLSPIVYDDKGAVRGVSADSGIFVDCLNIWWTIEIVGQKPTTPSKTTAIPKDPNKDVGSNPKVDPWKKDATGGNPAAGHQVTTANGATTSNGLQTNPAADAVTAKSAADKIAADNAAAQAKAIADAEAATKAATKKLLADAKTAAEKAAAEKLINDTKAVADSQNRTTTTPPGGDW